MTSAGSDNAHLIRSPDAMARPAEVAEVRQRRLSDSSKMALNSIRAISAVYVVLHHVVVNSHIHAAWTYAFRFGQEAVVVFFLLSGFVIYTAERRRCTELGGYYFRRIRRIYPPLLLALILGALIAALNGTLQRSFNLWALIGNLASLQDISSLKPGVIVDPFLGNSPLWSLSYEVFFYAIFPALMVIRRISRKTALTVVACASVTGYMSYLVIPNHFSLVVAYIIVWWSGAYLADLYATRELNIRRAAPLVAWMIAICIVSTAGYATGPIATDPGVFPTLPLRHFAAAVILILLALWSTTRKWILELARFGRSATYLASISYGLYVFHYPILIEWEWSHSSPLHYAVAILALITLAILGDRFLEKALPRKIG